MFASTPPLRAVFLITLDSSSSETVFRRRPVALLQTRCYAGCSFLAFCPQFFVRYLILYSQRLAAPLAVICFFTVIGTTSVFSSGEVLFRLSRHFRTTRFLFFLARVLAKFLHHAGMPCSLHSDEQSFSRRSRSSCSVASPSSLPPAGS
jgi:hypothetical protein